jgi:ABC-type phosphate/phosphonate transport system substrate-binding protein
VPERLVRRNGDLPAVPGGIRDEAGNVIGPDPATLPPDDLDFPTLWRHPKLLFGQACWGPMELGLAKQVRVVGQPDYSMFEGGEGAFYSSAIVMRPLPPLSGGSVSERNEFEFARRGGGESPGAHMTITATPPLRVDSPHRGEGSARIPLNLIRNKRLAFNSEDSMSGIIALTRDLAALGETLGVFSERVESGGHRDSIAAVAEGRADVAAIDCRSWALAQRFERAARQVAVVGWTARRMGLPYIAALNSPVTLLPD